MPCKQVASPPPQVQPQVVASRPVSSDQIAKASALLDSVVDSINSPRSQPVDIIPPDEVAASSSGPVASSPGQRVRALADALFGSDDLESTLLPSPTTPLTALHIESSSINMTGEKPPTTAGLAANEPSALRPSPQEAPVAAVTSSPTFTLEHADPTMLELEIQRRVEAATAALRKSPSHTKLDAGSSRRRISPNQISSPTLVSASTSVDTIPLPAVSPSQQSRLANSSSTRFGSRFKRLKGTLRAKTPIPGNEEAPAPLLSPAELKTPSSAQTATYNPEQLANGGQHAVLSATESGRFKISPPPAPTPPASAGPGLRGFISLFRKQRPGENITSPEKYAAATSRPTTAASAVSAGSRHDAPRASTDSQSRSAPASQAQFSTLRPLSPQSPLSQSFADTIPEDYVMPLSAPPAPAGAPNDTNDEANLQQLYKAAVNLGLDQAALQDLVARSPSTTSRTTTWSKLTRNNSVAASRKANNADLRDSRSPQSPPSEGRPSVDALSFRPPQSPLPSEGHPSLDAASPRPSTEIKQLTIRKHASPAPRNPPQTNTDPLRTVVRRTIIVPSDSRAQMDLADMLRKQSISQRRRSAGAGSVTSNRSLQDRAPTPPPPRAVGAKRFSTDNRTPPVPNLPPSFSPHASVLQSPALVEKSNSTYDSL
jgi:serine/arginine repetitive matrix protein 2